MKTFTNKFPSVINSELLKIALGVFLIFLCSKVQIPLKPVPVTLQTAGVLIIALCYNKKEALLSMISYIILGTVGVPVFANPLGLIGPTGGYIMGMLLCVYVISTMREKFGEDSFLKLVTYSAIGSVCIFAIGIAQLSFFVGFEKSLQLGLYPFIITGTAKVVFTGASVRFIKKL